MPFTIDGEWKPSKPATQKPIKVRLMKRGKSLVTVILNLSQGQKELEEMASTLKKSVGAGGSVKEGTIEIQGDKVESVKKWLKENGIKAS